MQCLSVIYYIWWLTSMEPSLHLWGKSQLDHNGGNLWYMLLFGLYFIENVCVCASVLMRCVAVSSPHAFIWFVSILLRMFASVLMRWIAVSSPHFGAEEIPIEEDWKCLYAFNNLKVMVQFFESMVEFCESIWNWALFTQKDFYYSFISLFIMGLFRLLISSWLNFDDVNLKILPFLLGFPS